MQLALKDAAATPPEYLEPYNFKTKDYKALCDLLAEQAWHPKLNELLIAFLVLALVT